MDKDMLQDPIPSINGIGGPFSFDIGFGPGNAPATHADLMQSSDVVTAAIQQVRQSLQRDVVSAAVESDMMNGKIASILTSEISEPLAFNASLQDKIQGAILAPLSQSIETTLPMGIQIPATPDAKPMPESVLIRLAAQSGDLGPAIEKWRREAAPRMLVKDLQYYAVVSNIQAILSTVPGAVDQFGRMVAILESEPQNQFPNLSPIGPSSLSARAIRRGDDDDTQQNSVPTSPFAVTAGPATFIPKPSMVQGIGQVASAAVELTPGLHPRISLQPSLLGPLCPFVFSIFPQDAPQFQASWLFFIPSPTGTYVGYEVEVISGPASSGVGWSYKVRSKLDGNNWSDLIECQGQVITPQPPPVQPPTTPVIPPIPVDPVPTPCVPPPAEKPCVRLCPPEEPDCPPPEYEVYKTNEDVCYVIKKPEKPHSSSDKLIASGEPSASWIESLCKECQPKKPTKPKPPGESGDGALGVHPVGIVGCSEFGAAPGVSAPNGAANLSMLFGLVDSNGTLNLPFTPSATSSFAEIAINTIVGTVTGMLDQYAKLVSAVVNQTGCANGDQISLALSKSVLGFVNSWTDQAFSFASNPLKQQSNYACPTILPNSQASTQAWLADNIDYATLECWVRACGERFPEYAKVADAYRTKLSPAQMGTLRQRKVFSEEYYQAQIRSAGMIRQDDAANVLQLLKQIPPVSDLVRFMVRDANDEQLVAKFGMDDEFTVKFGKDIQEWSEAQGVDPKYMQFAWRSHWSIPAPGQLFEMYHRLRYLPDGDPRKVSEETIRTALVQQDILPFWIDKFLAVSFRPLSRIDARRAFQIGSIDKAQLREAWQAQGYDDANAEILVEFTDKNRLLTILRSPWINRFATGEITQDEMIEELTEEGMRNDDQPKVVRRANIKLAGNRRKRCLSAYRKRFLSGEFTSDEALPVVESLGLTIPQASQIIGGWECERSALGKEFSASQLCQLLEDSLIDAVDFVNRAKRLGWSNDDAILLYRHCQRRLGIKSTLAEERQLKLAQQEEMKRARQVKAALKAAESASEKIENANLKMQRASVLRNRRILETAKNLANQWKTEVIDEIPWVNQAFKRFSAGSRALTDEIINAMIVTSQVKGIGDRAEFESSVSAWLDDLVNGEQSLINQP